jgi:enoyl-CoA hydratase
VPVSSTPVDITDAIAGVAVASRPPFAEVVLARPNVHNALNLAMWERVRQVFSALGADRSVRVVVIRGAGTRAFSAGADVAEFFQTRTGDPAAHYNAQVSLALETIMSVPQPVIAMVAGLAVGGGCEIAAACDLRIAGSSATFGIPINRLGVTLGQTEAKAVVSLIGPGRTKELLLTGRLIDAQEALSIGLINGVVPDDSLAERTWALADQLASGAPVAAAVNKLTVNSLTVGMPLDTQNRIERLTREVYDGSDLREGIAAFLEKRAPAFTGQTVDLEVK